MKSRLNNVLFFVLLLFWIVYPFGITFAQYSPNHFPGLKLWLRSDSAVTLNGNKVVQWNDCSGNLHHAIQNNPSNQPTLIADELNHLPGIKFNGINTYLSGDIINGLDTSSATVIILASGDLVPSSYAFRGYFSIGNLQFGLSYDAVLQNIAFLGGGTYTWPPGTPLPNTGYGPKVLMVKKKKGIDLEQFINNALNFTSVSPALNGPFTNSSFEIGHATNIWGGYHNGNIFEVLVYDKYLPDSLSTKVFSYLSQKYGGGSINLGPDLLMTDFCPTIIHAGTQFSHYDWSTGDTTESLSVNQNGSYFVKTTNIFGGNSYDTIQVTYPQIVLHDTIFCTDSSVSLSTGLDASYSYQWSDGQTTPTITVSDTGFYWVTVTKNFCSRVSDTIMVSEDNFPTLAWLGNDTSICSGNTIGLIHPIPLPSNLLYNWSTGDTTATIAISSTGDYHLTVSDSNSCVAKDTLHVTIGGIAPVVDFSFITACSGDTVRFTNLSIPAGDTWQWTFGDGQTSTLENPKNVYTAGGTYNVGLSVTSGICSNSLTKIINIPGSPLASFSLSMACIGNPFTFVDESIIAPGDSITAWDWDFGDASAHSVVNNPSHIYTTAGNFNVVLNIFTNNGCSGTFSDTIVVVGSAPLPAQFTLSSPQGNALLSSHTVDFEWNLSANTENFALLYSADQNFTNNTTRIFPIVSTHYQALLNISGTVYWKVIAYNLCGDSVVSEVKSFTILLPNHIPGLKLWLRSDSALTLNSNKVLQWNDCSGNLHHAIQNNPSNQPTLIADELNQLPGIKFNGINTYVSGDIINGLDTSSATVIILASGDLVPSSYAFRGYFSIGNLQFGLSYDAVLQNIAFLGGGTYTWPPGTPLPNTGYSPKVLMVKKKKGIDLEQFINNALNFTSVSPALNGPFTNSSFEIGRATNTWAGYHKGNIFEVLVYDKYLPDSVSTNVFRYLTDKYAPPVNLGRDITIPYDLCQISLDAGDRFINYYWSTGDTTQIINVSQSGDYSVTVTNIFNGLSMDTVHVSIPLIDVHDTIFCLGDTISISANMGAGYSYLWLPDSVTSDILTIFNPGTYSLTVIDSNNCSRTKSFNAIADSFAYLATLGPDRKICKGDYIGLTNGAQQAVSYLWSDGSGNSLLTINDAFSTFPVYSVTVSSANNCIARDTIQLNVNGVKALASFVSDSVCFGDSTHFFNQSSVISPFQIIDYLWDFGDSTFSFAYEPEHLYPDDGYHSVTLTIVTDSGCVSNYNKTVKVFSKPLVDFSPLVGCSGVPIPFIDKTLNPFGIVTQWNWNFNDSNNAGQDTSAMQNPIYQFDSAGVYSVKVIATSNAGCVDSVEKTVIIKKSPTMDFSITNACAEQTVFFHDLIDLQPWETIISYDWEFGDGYSSSIPNPYHIFDTAGIYYAVFTVMTSSGCEVSVSKPVDVGGIPQVDFIYSNNCVFNSTQFSDNSLISNGNINGWHWNFGGMGTSVDKDPVFIFPDTLVYNITLAVKTDHNCEDSVTHSVKIVAAPIAEFSLLPEYGIPPLPVAMVNTSIGSTNYLWSFGDGGSSTLTNPIHTYQTQGIFTVLLNAFNAIGCTDTVSAKVYVLPTKVDIAVIGAEVNTDNGRMSVAADLSNEGTRKIEHIDIAVDFGNGNILHEQWLGSLLEGEGLHYEFTVSAEVPSGGDVNFVCVQASLPGLTEEGKDNNTFCVALKDEFLISDMYPNPVKDIINIPYILPFEDKVTIEILNSLGSYVKEIYNGTGKEGYNRILTDISTLNSGVYTVRISFRDKVLRKKFVKL